MQQPRILGRGSCSPMGCSIGLLRGLLVDAAPCVSSKSKRSETDACRNQGTARSDCAPPRVKSHGAVRPTCAPRAPAVLYQCVVSTASNPGPLVGGLEVDVNDV